MTTEDFKNLIETAQKKWKLDLEKTFMTVSWTDNDYYPVFELDVYNGDEKKYDGTLIICSDKKLYNNQWCGPNSFYLFEDSIDKDRVCHDCLTLDNLSDYWLGGKNVNLLIATSDLPKNILGSIDPFKTRCVKNRNGDVIITFRFDQRDEGEKCNGDRVEEKHLPEIKEY